VVPRADDPGGDQIPGLFGDPETSEEALVVVLGAPTAADRFAEAERLGEWGLAQIADRAHTERELYAGTFW